MKIVVKNFIKHQDYFSYGKFVINRHGVIVRTIESLDEYTFKGVVVYDPERPDKFGFHEPGQYMADAYFPWEGEITIKIQSSNVK